MISLRASHKEIFTNKFLSTEGTMHAENYGICGMDEGETST